MAKGYYAGMEVEAPCGRCKGETVHRILSITDGVPEKLICVNCNSVHKFRPEKPVVAATRDNEPRATVQRASSSPSRFHELMHAEQAGTKAKPYAVSVKWEEGMWMDHPSFGLGRVQKKTGRKVDVLFQDGLKTLISS